MQGSKPTQKKREKEINLTVSNTRKYWEEREKRTEMSHSIPASTWYDDQSTVFKKLKNYAYVFQLFSSTWIYNTPSNVRKHWLSKHCSLKRLTTQKEMMDACQHLGKKLGEAFCCINEESNNDKGASSSHDSKLDKSFNEEEGDEVSSSIKKKYHPRDNISNQAGIRKCWKSRQNKSSILSTKL